MSTIESMSTNYLYKFGALLGGLKRQQASAARLSGRAIMRRVLVFLCSLPSAFQWFGLEIYDEISCEGEGYCWRGVVGVGGEGVAVCGGGGVERREGRRGESGFGQ